ncbi:MULTISPECIES: Fe-S cluster assembly protein SufD [unclassified Plantibacter]|uniref:Fe-S cluster assembly protein SufD n=1 Tax=unclassified Plantibacter TaxID=2624265 RepID=UPI0007D98127|nr:MULTISPECIES: Fe-S cluster assembly protein SufD [unclassified Plantibacter]MBF4564892.1 Fe-S cluster assembly protein SufD [Plantibacter sp. VKM Ac-2876]OAN27004.1 Fe-S cluster assembly protein SufD [Plantibacter sp. H53]
MTTAAPTQTEGQHGITAHSDGAGRVIPVQTRSERFSSYDVADFPAVTGREAVWKLSPVAQFTDLTAGELDGSPTPITHDDVDGFSVEWISRDDARVGSAGVPEERASANAWSSFDQALAISVTGEESKTLRLERSGLGDGARAAHTVITAAPFSRGLIIIENAGDARLTENVEIVVGEQADVTVVTVQWWDDDAVHLASHFASIGRDAHLKHVVVSLGGKVVRVNPTLHLAGQGSDLDSLGVYFSDAGQHLEQQVYMHHDAPNTRGRVTYKGALQGEGARSVWIGDVLISNRAVGTDSYEQNRNLVLSDGTRADSVPNLEIETGDIAGAGHASATGRFDDEQLFYLQARGIPEDEARRLVVRGFLVEIIQQIGDTELQERLSAAIEAELLGADGQGTGGAQH